MAKAVYSEEFRAQTVSLIVDKGKPLAKVAKELGVTTTTLRVWVKQHLNSQKGEYQRIQELERENKRLQKELAESQEIVEILKKTALILGKR